jgi:hypothetical protein
VVQTAVDTDTLAQTLCGNLTGLRVHQLIFQAGTTGIDNQNIHGKLPPKIKSFSFFAICGNITITGTIV